MSHLFLKYDADLDLEDYISSDFTLSYEKVSGDNYLNIFEQYLTKSEALPGNLNNMDNHIQLALNHEKFDFQMENFQLLYFSYIYSNLNN